MTSSGAASVWPGSPRLALHGTRFIKPPQRALQAPSHEKLWGLAAKRRVQGLVGSLLGQEQRVAAEDWSLLSKERVKHGGVRLTETLLLCRA